jgi:hypothetical protein
MVVAPTVAALLLPASAAAAAGLQINVAGGVALASTSDHFTCWNIDASANRGFFVRDLDVAKSYGAQLAYQAAQITAHPAAGRSQKFSLLRFGGSGNDALLYEFGGTKCPAPTVPGKHFLGDIKCLNRTWWSNLLGFTNASNARIIFGVSLPKWTGCGQGSQCGPDRKDPCKPCKRWNATNAREILVWTIAHGLDHLIYGLELGNEVDGMYTGAEQAENLQTLHQLTLELWPDAARRPLLLGPDAAHQDTVDSKPPFPTPRDAYVYDFFERAGELGLPIIGATLHKYIEVTTQRDTNASRLDETSSRFSLFQDQVNSGWAASGSAKPSPRSWGGEVGPHNGGAPPCNHSSMRWATFADSLWYADALASSARLSFEALCRQDYIGADYGLLDCATGTPLPDYWTLTLWTWLVGPTVLSVAAEPTVSSLRLYAHCTPEGAFGLSGSESHTPTVTLVAINLAAQGVTLRLTNHTVAPRSARVFQLAALDKPGPVGAGVGLNGTGLTLNARPLQLINGGRVPDLMSFEQKQDTQSVQLSPHSVTFVVYEVPGGASACPPKQDQ